MREDDILSSLNNYFHYESLRPGQLFIIDQILDGRDVFVCKETGFGKSLCFQLPGMMREGLVVVVSALLSRVERKCQELSEKVKCAYLNKVVCSDALSQNKDLRVVIEGKNKIWDDLRCVRTSGLKFLYVTLDYLMISNRLKNVLDDIYGKGMLQAIVIDDLNYGTQWIDSFRHDYSELGTLRDAFPKTSFLCFTGPLSQNKLSIAKATLHLKDPYILNEPSTRTNVSYQMMYVDENLPISRLVQFIKESYDGKSGIAYCSNEEYCKALVTNLKKNDVSGIFYTDKLTDKEKDWINYINKDGVVIVCLSGSPVDLNFQNIDFTVHAHIPIALDIFIEETSKVGRNGTRGDCIVLYNKQDSEFHLITKTVPYKEKIVNANSQTKKQLLAELKNYRRELFEVTLFAENESICRQALMLKYLNGRNIVEPCGVCDICVVMKRSFVVDMSFSLKKILMAIWTINKFQLKGVKSDDYIFASITVLIDLLVGTATKHTAQLCDEWFFGSFKSWDKNTLHTLIIVLLIQKFASFNLIANNKFEVYQNLIITSKGQEFLRSTSEFGIPFSSKDVRFKKWLNIKWVKTQFLDDLKAILYYHRKHDNSIVFDFNNYQNFCDRLISAAPGTSEEFKRIKFYYDKTEFTDLDYDLLNSCLMYHRILQSLKNGVGSNKAAYKSEAKILGLRVRVFGRF